MKTELQEQLLGELGRPDLTWKIKTLHGSEGGEDYRWLPIVDLPFGKISLGLSCTGQWARATDSYIKIFDEREPCVFFLPVLEGSPEVVCCLIVDGLKICGLSETFVGLFPFEDIVATALKSQSEYWIGLALKWVSFFLSSNIFNAELRSIIDTGPAQSIRHKAKSLLKR